MLMTPRTLTIPSTMSNSAMRHAVPDHDLQKMLRRQVQALRFQFLSMAGNLLTHVWPGCQPGRKCFHRWTSSSPTSHSSNRNTLVFIGFVSACGVWTSVITHQPFSPCLAVPQTELTPIFRYVLKCSALS